MYQGRKRITSNYKIAVLYPLAVALFAQLGLNKETVCVDVCRLTYLSTCKYGSVRYVLQRLIERQASVHVTA